MDINYMQLKESVEKVCCKIYINEEDFDNAVSEMLDTLNKLIECVSYHNLIRLFEVSIIFSSAILGSILCSRNDLLPKSVRPDSFNYYL